tara:strand:- start:249 stop:500 length:252 start_codon:yes stop_codon:yes gene_type:complete
MSVLTTIDGVPLFSSISEAVNWASQRGLSGYHTHMYQGQTGYMGGSTHNTVTNTGNNNNNNNNNSLPNVRSSSGGNGAGGASY